MDGDFFLCRPAVLPTPIVPSKKRKELAKVDAAANSTHLLYGLRGNMSSIEKVLEEQSKKLDTISAELELIKNMVKSDGLQTSTDIPLPFNPTNSKEELSTLIQEVKVSFYTCCLWLERYVLML